MTTADRTGHINRKVKWKVIHSAPHTIDCSSAKLGPNHEFLHGFTSTDVSQYLLLDTLEYPVPPLFDGGPIVCDGSLFPAHFFRGYTLALVILADIGFPENHSIPLCRI